MPFGFSINKVSSSSSTDTPKQVAHSSVGSPPAPTLQGDGKAIAPKAAAAAAAKKAQRDAELAKYLADMMPGEHHSETKTTVTLKLGS